MKTKVLLLSVVILLLIGIAGGVYWWLNRPQIITFSDGSKMTLLGVDYGRRHAVPGGKLPKVAARPTPPSTGARGTAVVVRNGSGSFTTPDDTLVVWVRAKYDYAPSQPGQPNQYHNFQFFVYDPAGTACAVAPSRNMSGNQQGDDVLALQFNAFPRREGKLTLRAEENYSGGQEMSDDKFVVSNPAAKKSFTKWTPEPVPDTQTDGDLAMTLTKLVAGADLPYQRNSDNPDDAVNKGVQMAFHVERSGKRVTNWQPASLETTDATGNRTAINYGPNGNQVQWQGDEGAFTYQYGLWPDEPAWKVRLEMTQTSDFNGDEQWTVPNIPVVPGSQQSINAIAGVRNVVTVRGGVVVRNNVPGGGNPAVTPAPFAETDLGGHHIKVFSVVQFTNQPARPAGLPANANFNPSQQTMLMIQVQPAVLNSGMRGAMIINGARGGNGVNGTQPADDGIRLTLAKVTDDQGNEITAMNGGTSTSGMGGADSTSTFRFNLRDIAGATNISTTIALHKNRSFEFTVKPEKAAANKD